MTARASAVRHLVIVLGDQLNRDASSFDDFEPERDMVWMAEVVEESEHVWTHKARIAWFLSAMRHFRDELVRDGLRMEYHELPEQGGYESLADALEASVAEHQPQRLIVTEPGAWRVKAALEATARRLGVPLEIRVDRHFLCTTEEFDRHAAGRKQLRMEYFYREMRRRYGVLMAGKDPEGGQWNFDKENRGSFGKAGPGDVPLPPAFPPDATTRAVLDLVERRFRDHPGSLTHFDWPVTRRDALAALEEFLDQRLPSFGMFQDAMWTGEPFLYHSLLSPALNLKLLNPLEVVRAAEEAYVHDPDRYPLPAVEGFVRQILGWREYVRGIYWRFMPEYLERNALDAPEPLPRWYWTGESDMVCLREAIGQTLRHGYAHHIQRLMVTGLFAMLFGVDPRRVHEWYLAVYVDAVEWVELPNTLGMSQYADGGIMASKPYAATGKYIDRMSNYCKSCRFKPGDATGESACPFTTLYWDFLLRHEKRLAGNPRMTLQLKNVATMDAKRRRAIRQKAKALREELR